MADLLTQLTEGLAGRYEVLRELGAGGMAIVFLARDTRHDRRVAIKVLRPELATTLGPERFLREIKTTARLSHPHILPLLDSGEIAGLLYYVMPFVDGESLRDRLNRETQLPIQDAIRIARDVADALDHAHNGAVIHRDIKPDNILLTAGHAIVADFGIARAIASAGSTQLTGTGIAIGTPAYMSPEQAGGVARPDPRADVYSLGCVLYEMLTGQPPFAGPTVHAIVARHMAEAVPSAQLVRPSVSGELQGIIDVALAKVPADRFSSAAEFGQALKAVGSGTGSVWGGRRKSLQLGSAVSRMCNRWNQVNAFEASFRSWRQRSPGRPQFFVVYGDDGNGHVSLVERLVSTRIRQLAEELAGSERGVVRKVSVPWPTRGDLTVRCRDLAISLFRELDPCYLGHDVSPAALTDLPALALTPIVVVDQEIRSRYWDSLTVGTLQWYLRSFWGEAAGEQPLFLVFLRVVFDHYADRRMFLRGVGAARRKKRMVDALEQIGRSTAGTCPCSILDELAPVTIDDVREWFNRHEIYDSEQKRRELIDALFDRSQAQPMTLVESALAQIHRTFVQDVAIQKGQAL